MTANLDPICTYQCEWGRHPACPEPGHCMCVCHHPYQRSRLKQMARRVWGRWT